MGDDGLSGWRCAWAVHTGEAHHQGGLPCQDHAVVRLLEIAGEAVLLAAVADGAGSASHSALGAEVVCTTLLDCAERYVCGNGDRAAIDAGLARTWLGEVLAAIAATASAQALEPRDLAATALLVVAWAGGATCMQVGDGVIVVGAGAAGYEVAHWPQRGEYANTTVFACDQDALAACQVRTIAGPIRAVALMSDGVQGLALHYASRAAHAPFFDALLPALTQSASGISPALNQALAAFLASPGVASRSDDDRALVLATFLAGPDVGDHG